MPFCVINVVLQYISIEIKLEVVSDYELSVCVSLLKLN